MAEQIAAVMQAAVRRLRTERGWSQRELSVLLRAQGIRSYTPNQIAQIETGAQRPDRLGDVAAFCAVFSISVLELIGSDDQVVVETGGNTVSTNIIANALDGQLVPPAIAELAGLDSMEKYSAEHQAARALGIDTFQFSCLLRHTFPNAFSFDRLRDQRAAITPDMSESSVRARRGHATREIVMRLKEVMDREGVDAIVVSYTAQVAALNEWSEIHERQEKIRAYEELTGTVFDPDLYPQEDEDPS